MKKSNIASVLVYLTYIAYGIFWIFVYFDNLANPPEEYPVTRMEIFFGAFLIFLGLIILGIKAIHIKTGFGLFSLICAAADAFGVYFIWWAFVLNCTYIDQWLAELDMSTLQQSIPFMILSLFPAAACISNLISTKRG